MQLDRWFEVSTCRHVSPPTFIAPTSKFTKTEPNRPLHLSEGHVVVVVSSPHQSSRCDVWRVDKVWKFWLPTMSAGNPAAKRQLPFGSSEGGGGGVDPIPCVSTHRISDPRSGPAQLLPHTSSSAATPTGSVHKSQTVSVVGMSGQLKRCNESWFGSLQSGQFAAGWLAGSILCR